MRSEIILAGVSGYTKAEAIRGEKPLTATPAVKTAETPVITATTEVAPAEAVNTTPKVEVATTEAKAVQTTTIVDLPTRPMLPVASNPAAEARMAASYRMKSNVRRFR